MSIEGFLGKRFQSVNWIAIGWEWRWDSCWGGDFCGSLTLTRLVHVAFFSFVVDLDVLSNLAQCETGKAFQVAIVILPLPAWKQPDNFRLHGRSWWFDMCCCIHINCLLPLLVGWLESHHWCHCLRFLGQWSSRYWWFWHATVDFWGPSTLGGLSPHWEWPRSPCCGSKLCNLCWKGLQWRGGCWWVRASGGSFCSSRSIACVVHMLVPLGCIMLMP